MEVDEEAERKHWEEVMLTLMAYHNLVGKHLERKQEHLNRLSDEYAQRLPVQTFDKLSAIDRAAQNNQYFFDEAVCFHDPKIFRELSSNREANAAKGVKSFGSQQHRNLAVLHSLQREWSVEGAAERRDAFDPLLSELETLLPVTSKNAYKQRVLVPGCGLARLPLEIAARGYACQGNEFSVFMAIPSNFILNGITEAESFDIHPWLERVSNVVNVADVLQCIRVPDITAGAMLAAGPFSGRLNEATSSAGEAEAEDAGQRGPDPSTSKAAADGSGRDFEGGGEGSDVAAVGAASERGDQGDLDADDDKDGVDVFPPFSMCLGDFVEIYGAEDNRGAWDGLVTCFFVDTAPVVLQYLEVIHKMLRPGGVWVNLGPLLYHWVDDSEGSADPRFGQSVELSWEELRHVIVGFGFEFVREEWRECTYTRNRPSMMWNTYRCIFFSVRKRMDVDVIAAGSRNEAVAASSPACASGSI